MSFLKIHFLWHLLWVIPFISLLYYHAALRRKKTLRMILGKRATDPEYISVSRHARYLKFLLLLTGVIMLILAAARPYWGQMIAPYSGRGRDLIVIFDVSKSMLAEDVQPSRLEHAKWFVRRLVDDCPGDRFGLIAFSGTSFLECPLTTDRTSFFQYLNELDTSSIPVGGTNVQAALETALKAFDAAETGHRAIILITDGDELDGDSKQVIDELKKKHIPVFAVGIGDPMKPGLIPVKNPDGTSSFMKDSAGEIVKTRLNEKALIELAQATGGCYARSTAANINIDRVLRKVQSLEPKELEEGMKTRPIERFYYPLTAGLILLLMWFCISERKETKMNNKLKTSISLKLILLMLLSGTTLAADTGQNGADKQLPPPLAAENDKTKEPSALDAATHVDNPVELYNMALELQRKNAPEAGDVYRRAINMATDNRQVQSASYQNMGVMQHEKARGKIQESMKLVEQQNLDGALKSLDAVKKELTVAEDLYVEAMVAAEEQESGKKTSTVPENTSGTDVPAPENVSYDSIAMNQQKLLIDRSMVEELKKKIEELKKKQQEAQKKIQQAQQEQQKQNQDKQQQQNQQDKQEQKQDKQQQQNQQDKQEQKQDKQQQQNQQDKQEQKQDKQQQQNQQNKQEQKQDKPQQSKAEQSRKDAQQAVDDLKQSAEELKQENLQKSAQDAADELKKAEQAQQKNQGKKAEEHLENALDKLRQAQQKNQEQQDKQNQENKQKSEKQDEKKDDAKQKDGQPSAADKQDKPLPQQQQQKQAAEAAAKEQEEKIDKQQAEALLRAMADQEKNLRDALKENMKRNYRHKPVEKDW
jgi:Ca-activated chloride channel family protein